MTGVFRRVWRSRYLEAGRFLRISCSLSGDMVWGDKDLLTRMTILGEEKMGFGEIPNQETQTSAQDSASGDLNICPRYVLL